MAIVEFNPIGYSIASTGQAPIGLNIKKLTPFRRSTSRQHLQILEQYTYVRLVHVYSSTPNSSVIIGESLFYMFNTSGEAITHAM